MIENTVASVVYTADGAQTQWTIPFTYGHVEDVKLFVKVGTADIAPVASNLYSIDTELNTITYPLSGDPLAANDKVIVMRVTEQTQEESSAMLSFKSEDIERMADKLTMEVQELQEQLSRCIAFNPVDAAEGEVDAQKYIDDLTDLKDTATTQAGIATSAATTATTQAGLASDAKTAAETAQGKAEKWAEGTDEEVAALGGTHSAEGWAGISQTAAESENVQTVIANMSDINSVADNITDVTTVSNISAAVSNVADNDTEVLLVSDNMASVITTASNINNVNTVAGVSTKVSTVADNISDVETVADNISDVGTVANASTAVSTVANDINAVKAVNNNKTNIDAVATNQSNINAVASNETNINAVNANKTNIDAVAGNATNINTVATNATAVTSVATAIADVSAVADDLTDINAVADDLTNIDAVAASLPDIQEKQNKVLTNNVILDGKTQTTVEGALEAVSEEWAKPADWVDIRSGSSENSIIFLTGHKADYSAYNTVSFIATLSNTSHTYDVFIDGVYYNSYNSGATFELNWSTAGITTGWDVTYPEALRTHTITISATDIEHDTITAITSARPTGTASDVNYQYGTLWAHFEISNEIDVQYLFAMYAAQYWSPNLEAITAKNDKITVSNLRGFFGKGLDLSEKTHSGPRKLSYLPEIDLGNHALIGYGAFNVSTGYTGNLKEIRISNGLLTPYGGACNGLFSNIHSLKRIVLKNANIGYGARVFSNCYSLEEIPSHYRIFGTENINLLDMFTRIQNAAPTIISFAQQTAHPFGYIRCGGSSTARLDWLKGLILNTNMTLSNSSSPQVNVSYTGLDRQALVTMFKSMPYNVGYTVVGSPTITSGVASGFSNNNYLKLPSVALGTNFEFHLRFTTPSDFSAASYAVVSGFGNTYYWIHCRSNGRVGFNYSSYATLREIVQTGVLSTNTVYDLILSQQEEGTISLSYKKATESEYVTVTNNNYSDIYLQSPQEISLGISLSEVKRPYPSSIDLNNTYIKINGVPWFTGKAAMTKTCNVVGCTGTADLTAEDKAIATDKGWALTLS